MNTIHEMSRLQKSCREKGPLCVGLDTDSSYLPPEIIRQFENPAKAVLEYNLRLIEECSPFAGCFKVQIAYYEAMGLEGLSVYAQTVQALRKAGIPVIADVKRGDIADTAKAYARAHFSGDFESDIITVNPYMGFDTLEPFLQYCSPSETSGGKGFFVLLRTSNPGMKDIENLELASGGAVLDRVGQQLNTIDERFSSMYPHCECSPVGAVVGCTEEEDARLIRDTYPNVFFLIPGYGAQGGAARIAAALLGKAGGTVNSSRGILTAWMKDAGLAQKRESGSLSMADIVKSAAAASKASRDDLLRASADYQQ